MKKEMSHITKFLGANHNNLLDAPLASLLAPFLARLALLITPSLIQNHKLFNTSIPPKNMGRIKSLMVKRAAKQLLEGETPFSDSFEKNKKILGSSMPSKPIRNKIAGYIAHLKRVKKVRKREIPIESPEPSQYVQLEA